MTPAIVLTAAELAFLLASGADPADAVDTLNTLNTLDTVETAESAAGDQLRTRLGITPDEQTTVVLEAGLASLLVRGLADIDQHADQQVYQHQVLLNPVVAGVAESLCEPQLWAQLSLAADGLADTCLLVQTASARFLVAPRAHRCFEIAGLDPDQPYAQPLLTIARGFLETYPPAMASLIVQTADRAGIAEPPQSFVLAVDANRQWSLGIESGEPGDPESDEIVDRLTADEAFERLRSALASLQADRESSDEPL